MNEVWFGFPKKKKKSNLPSHFNVLYTFIMHTKHEDNRILWTKLSIKKIFEIIVFLYFKSKNMNLELDNKWYLIDIKFSIHDKYVDKF